MEEYLEEISFFEEVVMFLQEATELVIFLVLFAIAWYMISEFMECAKRHVPHTEQDHITVEEKWLQYLYGTNPASVFPAVAMVPEAPSITALRANQIIGECATCLAPADARCSQCKSVPYCSRKCQLIHWRKEHKEKCHKLLHPSANAAHRPRPQMDFLVGLNAMPHGRDAKKCDKQEGISDYQSGTQTVKRQRNKSLEKKSVTKSKQTELKNEDGVDANFWVSNISSEESSGIATIEETLENQDGPMPKITPQNRDESTKEPGQKNEPINSPAKVSSINSGSDTYADFKAGMHPNRNRFNQVEEYPFGKVPLRGTASFNKPSNSLEKSVHVLKELQDNKVAKEHFLELQKPQYVPSQTVSNSMQSHETNRLEEELKKLEKLRDELLNENSALRDMQNNFAKELESLRQRIEEQDSKNYNVANFMEFSYLELEEATNNFDEKLKIGEGGFGSVYKGVLHCTTVAIKILRKGGSQGGREFYQEVEILRKVRHPNIVTLLGGCSQNLALVYEFIPNGSLENYLRVDTGRRLLSWKTRIEIASDICLALIFLHSTKPHGIAHGDLKPANILLDSNYQGKLSDFGISCQLMKTDDTITPYHQTEQPKGTVAYIDPEYLRTGEMNPQCDVYSFGVVLLQLVTGKSAAGIIKLVQDALRSHLLNKEIDSSAKWPYDKAIKTAKLGLYCCNPNRKNRPNLATEVWSEIESLKSDVF